MARVKSISGSICGPVPANKVSEVVYYLQEFHKSALLDSLANVVVAEFCCRHESGIPMMLDIFMSNVCQDVNVNNLRVVESSIIALEALGRKLC